jgi:hypothetical protein
MLRYIIEDEGFPIYSITDAGEVKAHLLTDIPDDLIKRYEAAESEYNAVQTELGKLYFAKTLELKAYYGKV